jgi:hypothetical protein
MTVRNYASVAQVRTLSHKNFLYGTNAKFTKRSTKELPSVARRNTVLGVSTKPSQSIYLSGWTPVARSRQQYTKAGVCGALTASIISSCFVSVVSTSKSMRLIRLIIHRTHQVFIWRQDYDGCTFLPYCDDPSQRASSTRMKPYTRECIRK